MPVIIIFKFFTITGRQLKPQIHIFIFVMIAVMVVPLTLSAQDDDSKTTFPLDHFYVKRSKSPFRAFFRNFRLGVSIGYGSTFMNHSLTGFGIYQPATGEYPSIFAKGNTTDQFTNWVNQAPKDSLRFKPGGFSVLSDTTHLGFKGHAMNIPLKLTLHYEYKRYRIGIGYSYELMSLGSFHPTDYADKISDFKPASATGFMNKYFFMLGASFLRIDNYLFTGDVNIGGFNPGHNFDKSIIDKGIYVNLGVTVERELSEYLRLFVRPSFDIKSYDIKIPEVATAITHHMNAFYVNAGISYTLPELRKCYNHDCKIQMNHAHGNKEYRSRVHPIYKKQNPMYGENHPTLIKYKGRNKKKLNPY